MNTITLPELHKDIVYAIAHGTYIIECTVNAIEININTTQTDITYHLRPTNESKIPFTSSEIYDDPEQARTDIINKITISKGPNKAI